MFKKIIKHLLKSLLSKKILTIGSNYNWWNIVQMHCLLKHFFELIFQGMKLW